MDARDNTRTTYTSEDKGVPIYWLNGNKVVDDYEDFYDGTWDDEANSTDESGSARSLSGFTNSPFTGSDNDGTEIFDATVSRALGASNVMVGRPNNATDGEDPLTGATSVANTDTQPFYALSGIFIAPNNPATGEAAITGRPRVGEELSADTSGITDPDGIDQDAFTYQWQYDDGNNITDINGATNADYILTDTDAKKHVRVSISFTDDSHNSEGPITSTRTQPVVPENVLIRNTYDKTTSAGTLSTDISRFAQEFTTGAESDGYAIDSVGLKFETIAAPSTAGGEITATLNKNSSGAPGNVLCTLTDPPTFAAPALNTFNAPTTGTKCPKLDAATKYFVVVERANNNTDVINISATSQISIDAGSAPNWSAAGYAHFYKSANTPPWEQYTSSVQLVIEVRGIVAIPNVDATGVPTIGGTPQEGQTLTADTSAITDGNGLPSSLNFQWVHVTGSTQTDIDGATSSTYTLTEADLDKTIIVKVSFTDQDGYPEGPLASAPSGVVVAPNLLVKNTLAGTNAISTQASDPKIGQAFTTGSSLGGYQLASVGFRLHDIGDPASAGNDLEVTLNEVATSGEPGTALCALEDPGTFVANSINRFTVPSRDACPKLSKQTTYFAVLHRVAFTGSSSITVGVATSQAEDEGSDPNWSIADTGYLGSGITWSTATENYRIEVTGEEGIETTVPQGWSLTPSGLVGGEKFRLLFITDSGHSSANTEIENYNAYVQSQANTSNSLTDIKAYSSWFRVLGSTEDVDARDNTMTTGTGVPIYWVNGDKVADNYPDFYDGSWDSETYARDTGVLSSNTAHVWTGSQNNGTQSFTSGVSNALGASSVRRGTLNGNGNPLLSFTQQAGTSYAYYALSNIFVVPNSDATGQPDITGTPRVNQTLSVDTSGITDPEGTANAAFTYQWIRIDDGDETDIDGANRSTYNPTNQDVDKQLKVRVSFTDDQGFTEGPLVSEPTFPIAGRDLLVRNTGQTVATALNPRLSTTRPKIAQGFTTGPDTEGYTLESLGIRFQSITDTSTAGTEITATLNEVSSTNPGTALCTLNDPAFFTSSGVHTFDAPGTCPTLAATTTYFLVIARSNVNSGTIRFNATNKTVEDPGSESGWSINNGRQEYRNASWEPSAGQPFMIEVKGESVREVVESSHRTWVENRRGDAATDYDNTGEYIIAQGFRTGDTAGVYEIHEISIDFDQGQPDPAAIQVRIVESSSLKTVDDEAIPTTYWKGGNFPARRIGSDDGTHTFTLSLTQVTGANILEANTNYFITIESTSNDSSTAAVVRMTDSHNQTTGDGWAVDNHVYVKDKRDGSGWTRKTHQARIRIAGEYHEGISIVNEPRAYESCLGNLTNNRETLPEGLESCAFATQVDVGTTGSFPSNLSGVETTAWLPLYETIDFEIVIWPLVPAGGWVDVEYATEYPPGIYAHGSPAIADIDYIKKKGKVRFLPGDIAKTVSINIIDDRHEDSNEYVQVKLPSQETRHSSVPNYSLIRRSAFGTIYNTEETVELQSLNVSDLTVTEGEGATAEFTVWLSGEVTAPVLAHYATHDGSAKAGEHYTAASGTLLIPHGETSVTVSVPILNDEVYTGDRKFRLAISKPVNAGIIDPSGDATIEDDDPQPLTARFTNMPSGNHGESSFSFNISFNQDVATQYLVMQNDAMTVTNGEITRAERIDGSRDFWHITVQPYGGADVTVLLPATVSCSDTGAICSYGSTPMPQNNSITHTFPGTQLNAKFTGLDHYHDGSTPFNFTLGFSEEVDTTAAEIRDHALTITGGTFKTVVQKDDDSTRRWEVTVKPAGVDDIEVSIAGAIDCATDGHICTSEGEILAQAATQHSTGPELISVSDATVQEADGAELVFTVSIPEVWFGPDITVDYATSHGTATADDYTPTSGTLDFRWHESLTVTVPVLTDTITEDAETITLTLSNPVNVVIADGEATGTIQDAEPVAARPLDSQPTGLPVITGAFRADEPLTAGTSAISDANGLDEVSYSYQWIMSTNGSDADLSGATASTYTPNNDQVGNTFKVRVSFTDDDSYAHTLTSEATIPLTQPTDPIVWSADMLVVEYSSISIGAASADLFTNIGGTRTLSIQSLWSYVPNQDLRLAFNEALDDADDLTLIVGDLQLEFPSGSSGNGSFKWTGLDLDWQDSETIAVSIVPTSTLAETTVPNTAAAGQPTITGTPQVGQVLTADISQVTDVDGLLSASYLYQWTAGDVNILSATRQSYTLDESDLAKTIKVTVSFNDDRSNPETLTSAATDPVAARPNTAAGGAPSIQGVLQDQRRLTADTAGITDADGLTSATFTYQWTRVNDGTPSDITGQTASAYTLTTDDVGRSIQLQVIFTDDRGATESLTSAVTDAVVASGATRKLIWLSTIKVEDHDNLGIVFSFDSSAEEGRLSPAAFTEGETTYSVAFLGTSFHGTTTLEIDLSSLPTTEQTSTWRLFLLDTELEFADATMTETSTEPPSYHFEWDVTAVAINDRDLWHDGDVFIVSLQEAVNIPATGAPTISGTPQVNQTLTADTSAISDADGLNNVSYNYQWLRDDADIAGQTNSTYQLVPADEGKTIKVRVTFNDDAGNAESLTSTATTSIAAQPAETPAVLLTASFANVPADHNGSNFTFQLSFSENVEAGYARIRDHAFTVTGATIDSASRITQGSNQGWNVEVNPTGNEAITITLPETTDCDASGAICTDDSRKLSHPTSAIVAGPPAISVSDATVQEAEGAVLVFSITLSHASSRTVTVDYATSDGTAQAGSDYTAASATLTFNAGDTSQTVQVTVLTDSEDESQETLTLTLSNPSQATLDDGTGTGTIENGESSSGTQEDPPAEDPPVVLLTASFGNMPATHNGSEFTFDLAFSEDFPLSYVTLRDDAFTVDGGNVQNAQRKVPGSNQTWTITVKPLGAGTISITLPETTDCNATGAICTDDERKLSNSTPASIAGPQ